MDQIIEYAYEQKILFLKQISIDYNLDYNNLISKYLDYYKSIEIVKEQDIDGEQIFLDKYDNKYNKNGFRLN
tara:strand:- start:6271 stop:6486 length:216 start_codon:yes stop_codon:yes gene_type:complete